MENIPPVVNASINEHESAANGKGKKRSSKAANPNEVKRPKAYLNWTTEAIKDLVYFCKTHDLMFKTSILKADKLEIIKSKMISKSHFKDVSNEEVSVDALDKKFTAIKKAFKAKYGLDAEGANISALKDKQLMDDTETLLYAMLQKESQMAETKLELDQETRKSEMRR